MGEITRHGPHQVAQKSKIATLSPLICAGAARQRCLAGARRADTHDLPELVEGLDCLDHFCGGFFGECAGGGECALVCE